MFKSKRYFYEIEIGQWFEESMILYKRISENQAQNCTGVRVTFYQNNTVWAER